MNDRSRRDPILNLRWQSPLKLVDDHAGVEQDAFTGDLAIIEEVKIVHFPQRKRILINRSSAAPEDPVDVHPGSGLQVKIGTDRRARGPERL